MSNSTILADLTIQIQDSLNPGQTLVARKVPQYVNQTSQGAYASFYYQQGPNSTATINIGFTNSVSFLYCRNATPGSNSATCTITFLDVLSSTPNSITLTPGSFMVIGAMILPTGTGGMTFVEVVTPANSQSVVLEIVYGV